MKAITDDSIDQTANARRFGPARARWEQSVRWPNGASVALSFVLNIEEGAELSIADGDDVNESVHEVVHQIEGQPDYCLATHFEYGARIGYGRVLRRFVDRAVPLTLNVCGRALERTPWVAADARRHGFEMCGHGWRWESPVRMTEAEERAAIAKTAAIIERLGGRAPAGWHNKSSRSTRTRRLLREHGGFRYDSDDYGDELPYLLDLGGSPPHVVLPYGFDSNDMRFFSGSFVRAADFSGYVIDAIDALLAERDLGPRLLTVGLHTRIIGRPGRIAGLDQLLDRVRTLGDAVCVMQREDIARHWLDAAAAA